ncbi:MAG TPA: hypothetical protein VMT70_12135 [Vicinamibacteria bacterium]|nr:hypothetical protein [Vicinamibacteria bacterium]
MPQRYRVRLADGTVVAADPDSLERFADDERAMAQAVGTQAWRPLREVIAEEEGAARLARALIPPKPRPDRTPPPPSSSPPPAPSADGLPADEPPAFGHPRGFGEPAFREPDFGAPSAPGVQVLADTTASASPAGSRPSPVADLPIIRMKPLDDEPRPRQRLVEAEDRDEEYEEARPRHDRLEGPLKTVIEAVGRFLSRCLSVLEPHVRRLGSPKAALPAPRREAARSAAPSASARQPLRAPTPVSDLAVIPFAPDREPAEAEDVYASEGTASPAISSIWRWTRRFVVLGALAAGVAYAVIERERWLPGAGRIAEATVTKIDDLVRSRQTTKEQEQALAEAAARLPHLAPETIRLLFSRSPTGVLDPPDAFQLADEAAERGLSALTHAEAGELKALQAALLARLSPTERSRVREYEKTRHRRAIFPFENPHVLELVARGAQALPAASRERLQALNAKAVAAGLDVPVGGAAGPTGR